MPESRPQSTPLPESLRQQLEEFRRDLWRTKIAEAAFAGIFGLLLSYLVVFGLERLIATPPLLRLAILACGTSLSAIFAPLWLHRWVWRHRHESQLARLIARKHPGLGDRLLGVIELGAQDAGSESMSPRLRAAAMEAVAAETRRRKLYDSLPASRHRRWSLVVGALFVGALLCLLLVPEAGLNSLKRWLLPLSSTPRYTFTVLEPLPSEIPVPLGEAFALDFTLTEDSEWRPAAGRARYGRQDPVSAELTGDRYRFPFPGQHEEGTVRVEIGDHRQQVRIVPSLRPSITRSSAEIEFPDYLQLEKRSTDLPAGVVTAVEGSRVSLHLEATRPLAHAEFGALRSPGEADPGEADPQEMRIRGKIASTPPLEVGRSSFELPFSWRDELDLNGAEGYRITVEGLPDQAPQAYLQGVAPQLAILPEETIDLEISGEDDFGLREFGLEWQGEFTRPSGASPASGSMALGRGAPDLARASESAAFSPATHSIEPQKLTLRAYSLDYLPDRPRSYSRPVVVYVLSRDEHANMLKNRFDRAISQLEDLARRERGAFEENQRLERLDGSELQDEETRRRLARQEQDEREQTRRMAELSEDIEELLSDSTRNGTIDKHTLRRMAEMLKSMKELAEEDMPPVAGSLGQAGDPRSSPEAAESELDDAVRQQRENLEKLRETIERANEANRRFEADSFVNRLKKAADEERGIASALLDASDRLGLHPAQLDPSDLGKLDDVTRQQVDTSSDVRWIREDLGHFFTRTNESIYREVLDEMVASGIDLGLEDIRRQLLANHGFTASVAAHGWADQLGEWADMLADSADQQGGGGGGGGGGGAGPDEDFEFMLRVMRLVQQEQDLRARTRSLETMRRSMQPDPKP